MPAPRSHRRARLAALVSVVLAITGFQFFLAPPAAQADVSTKITPPYSQDWTNVGLITANDDWSGVAGVQGYLGDDDPGTPVTGVDPQTVTAEGSVATDVIANQAAPNTNSAAAASPSSTGSRTRRSRCRAEVRRTRPAWCSTWT